MNNSKIMKSTWCDIFKEFGKESGMPYDSIEDWRPCQPPFHDLQIDNTIIIWLKNGGKILYTPKRTKFEIGKCYEHTDGTKMRIIAKVNTHFYGWGLLGETDTAEYMVVGREPENAVNWKECEDFAKEQA